MALNPTAGGDSHNWNYTKPENPGYSLELIGTVKSIQEVQAMKFGSNGLPSTPDFWDDGNPKMNIRVVLAGPSGGFRTLTFQPASKAAKEGKKKSIHLDLFAIAGGVNMMGLLEKTIKIATVAPPTGFGYGKGNPRPWAVELLTDRGPYQLKEPLPPVYLMPVVLANTAASGGMMNPAAAAYVPAAATPGVAGIPDENGFVPAAPTVEYIPGAAEDDEIPF